MADVTEEITGALNNLCALWTHMDQPRILDLWDGQEPNPYLLAQEKAEPIIGWNNLETYYRQVNERLVRCSMRVWDINAKLLSDDLAVALYQMHWNGEIKGSDHLFGIDSRVTIIFRNRAPGWLICHYVEAPTAPMLHLQKYYGAMVDPDFIND